MKTIDINLLGNLGKVPLKPKTEKQGVKRANDIDPGTKNIAVYLVTGSCAVFLVSLGVWSMLLLSNKNMTSELKQTTKQCDGIQAELDTINTQVTDAQNKKKILELKKIAEKQLNYNNLLWSKILKDISRVVPQKVKIVEISQRNSGGKDSTNSKLEITGQVNSNQMGALKLISYFVLNINENLPYDSYLKDATIDELRLDDNSGLYEFTIVATIKSPSELDEIELADSAKGEISPDKSLKPSDKATENIKADKMAFVYPNSIEASIPQEMPAPILMPAIATADPVFEAKPETNQKKNTNLVDGQTRLIP